MTSPSFSAFAAPGFGLGGLGGGLDLAPGPDEADPIRSPAPGQECGHAYGFEDYPAQVDLGDGKFGRFFGRIPLHRLRAMAKTPAVSSSIDALISAALSGGISLTQSIRHPDDPQSPPRPLADVAALALEMCRRSTAHMEFTTPLVAHLREMGRTALLEGHKLAEPVMAPDPSGPPLPNGEQPWRIDRIKPKPRWCYRFEVDVSMNVVAIPTYTAKGEWERVDPGHFARLTWDGRDGDPRGMDCIHPAHLDWNELVKADPYLTKYLRQFGVPNRYGTIGPGAVDVPYRDPATGELVPGKPAVPAVNAMANSMQRMEGGQNIAGSHGSDIKVVETAHDGSALFNGLSFREARIVKVILHQVRATTEAKHGSRADSETGQDVMGNLVRFIRSWLCAYARSVYRMLVAANLGADVADDATPEVSLGKVEPQDFAAYASAIAQLTGVDYFTEAQYPELDNSIGVTPRRKGDIRPVLAAPKTPPTPAPAGKGVAA